MENLTPHRVEFGDNTISLKYSVLWTPTLLILDGKGREFQRQVGVEEPEELIPALMLGIVKVHLGGHDYDSAGLLLDRLLDQFPQSHAAPEAEFFRGVCGYKANKDGGELKNAYDKLQKRYAESVWAKRATAYKDL